MHFKNITRRTLIRGSAGAVLGLPWLELTAGKSFAQTGAPKRLLIYFSGEGNMINLWKPNVASGAALPAALPPVLTPLNQYKSKLNLLHPVDNVVGDMMSGNGHNKAGRSILSCNDFTNGEGSPAKGPSIDQYMKQKLGVKSLELKVNGDGVGEYQMLFSGPGQSVSGEANPQRVFDRLFKTLPATGGGAPPPVPVATAADRLRAKNKDILSLVKENFTSVRNQLGKEDQTRLDIHAQRLSDLEKELGSVNTPIPSGGGLAAKCGSPGTLPTGDGSKVNRAQAMNAAMAMACNFAQIVTIQDTNYDSQSFPWLGNVSLPGGWHQCVHERSPASELQKGFTWYASAFKDILDAMNAVPEGDGTMLDNSLVMWITEYGDGASHSTMGIPIILAGSLGGKIRTDRFLSFANGTSSTNRLFVTIMQLFGMSDNSFGIGPRNSGTLPGIA
ncbi:MAG: DUF1552 domain-containing protein [Deltaproteobacteria bacterium]|nr:DUF1552 domain-containing protein [Deltaproteobacteria bacterium]